MKHSKVFLAVTAGMLAVAAMAAAKSRKAPTNVCGSVKTTTIPGCVHKYDNLTALTAAVLSHGATIVTNVRGRTVFLCGSHCANPLYTKGSSSE